MTRPRVLLGSDIDTTGRSREYVFAYSDYVTALKSVGLEVLLVPVTDDLDAAGCLQGADGLVLPGGDDLLFENPLPEETPVRPERQQGDELLVTAALEMGIPLLGICYGMQLINQVLGGSLIRHLPQARHHQKGVRHGYKTLPAGSWLDLERWEQPSWHHQAVEQCARGLEPFVEADDGCIEGFLSQKGTFVMGVQWHVEKRESRADELILKRFCEAVKQHKIQKK